MTKYLRLTLALLLALAAVVSMLAVAGADHRWRNYHWGRTSNPFTLHIVDSMSSDWDATLAAVSADWSQSSVLDTTVVSGDDALRTRKQCKPVTGKIRACNAKYGNVGWIGLATIWIDGDGHIVKGTAKMNDTYFALSAYNDPDKKQSVACMEVGHDFGLDHNDNGATGGTPDDTCMNDQEWFAHPNSHDFEELEAIYNSHNDAGNTYSAASASPGPGRSGEATDAVPAGAGPASGHVFVQPLAGGGAMISHVVWAEPR